MGVVAARSRSLDLGPYGLTVELPPEWFAGLALLLVGAVAISTTARPRGFLVAAYMLAIIVVIYGTIPFLVDDPQYAWTYKHIGVTRFLADAGQVDPDLDIYNRWPAFFALAAAFSAIAGAPNPLEYAQWAELVFMPIGALALAVAVLGVVRDLRVVSLAVIFFVVTAWVAQMYCSAGPRLRPRPVRDRGLPAAPEHRVPVVSAAPAP